MRPCLPGAPPCTTPHATYSSHLDCFISQGGDANTGGRRRGTGVVLTRQPAQRRSPSSCRGPARFWYFASLYLIFWTKTAGILCSQPQREMILGIYRFLNSCKKQGGERVRSSHERLYHSVERCHWFTWQLRDRDSVGLIYQLYYRAAVHQLPSWTLGSGNLMCDSCAQPVASSILKRSIKKRLMVVQQMTAQKGEQGWVNKRAETYITGIVVSKWSVVGRKSIVTSHKAHLSFAAESSTAVSLPGSRGAVWEWRAPQTKATPASAWSICR